MKRTSLALFALAAVSAPAADTQLLRLLPPDAAIVVGIDIEASKNSPFGRYLLNQTREDSRDLQDFIDLTGFDPRRDLREVYVASPRPVEGPGRKAPGLFLAKGVFNQARILDAVRLKGGQSFLYQGITVISPAKQDQDGWIALLDSTTALGGSPEDVRSAIARRAQPQDAPQLAEVRRLASRYDAWLFTLTPTANLRNLPNNPNGQMLRSIEQLTGGARFGAKVEFESLAVARSEKDAVALQDVVRFLAGMIQLNRENNTPAEVASLLESLQINVKGNTVQLSLAIAEVDLERLLEAGAQRSRKIARVQ